MRFEAFIALRYLAGRRKQAFIYLISLISVLGVSIGVAALVIVLGVYNGFTTDIREKILGANAHIILTGQALSAPAGLQPLLTALKQFPAWWGQRPFCIPRACSPRHAG